MTTFSIITPSFRGAEWLELAIASVADQGGKAESGKLQHEIGGGDSGFRSQVSDLKFSVEHLVQDACSDDGTAEILARHPHIRAFVEKDAGMYDAINRGLRRADGEILAWLNCDEQYLPGALARVADFFAAHPETDFLIGGMIITDGDGQYLCSRKMLPPLAIHTRVCHLSAFSCGIFFRRRVIDQHGLFFDPAWKAVGDAEWILRALEKGLIMRSIPDFTSVFTDHGGNLGGGELSTAERNRLRDAAPGWQRIAVPLIAAHHRLRRWLAGIYRQEPFTYEIYTRAQPGKRTRFQVDRPTTLWKQRFTLLR